MHLVSGLRYFHPQSDIPSANINYDQDNIPNYNESATKTRVENTFLENIDTLDLVRTQYL